MPSFAARIGEPEPKGFPCLYPRNVGKCEVDVAFEEELACTSASPSDLQDLAQDAVHIENYNEADQRKSTRDRINSIISRSANQRKSNRERIDSILTRIPNTFGTPTPRDCIVVLVASSLQVACMLVALGKVEARITSSTMWLRGAILGCYILFPCGFSATVDTLILRSPPRLSRAIVSVLTVFIIVTLVSLIPAGHNSGIGYVVLVAGGGFLGHVPILSMAFANGANLKAIAFFMVGSSLNFNFVIFNGVGACIWYPLLAKEHPVISGLLFSMALGGAEQAAVKSLGLTLSNFFSNVPGCSLIVSSMLMHYHSYMESFRLSAIVYGVIDEPSGTSWVYAMVFSFIINLTIRSSWSSYLFHKLVGFETFLRPNCITMVHRNCRYSCGYFRFAGMFGLILARAVLLGFDRISEWWFNSTVLLVLVCCFAEEILEDCAAYFIESMQWDAPWPLYSRKFYESCTQGDLRKLYEYTSGFPKIAYVQEKFHVLVVVFASSCASMFAVVGLVPFVSVQFLLGQCDTAEFSMLEGGTLVWSRAVDC